MNLSTQHSLWRATELTLQPQQQDNNNKDHCNATWWLTPQSLDPLWSPSSGQTQRRLRRQREEWALQAAEDTSCIRASQLLLENAACTWLPHRLSNNQRSSCWEKAPFIIGDQAPRNDWQVPQNDKLHQATQWQWLSTTFCFRQPWRRNGSGHQKEICSWLRTTTKDFSMLPNWFRNCFHMI